MRAEAYRVHAATQQLFNKFFLTLFATNVFQECHKCRYKNHKILYSLRSQHVVLYHNLKMVAPPVTAIMPWLVEYAYM